MTQLHPRLNGVNWTIKARAIAKSQKRPWRRDRASGILFNVDFQDTSGTIRAVVFREVLYEEIKVRNYYYISKGTMKARDINFNQLSSDYEITFVDGTKVTESNDIAPLQKINSISAMQKKSTVDVIGVCREVGDLKIVQKKKNEIFNCQTKLEISP